MTVEKIFFLIILASHPVIMAMNCKNQPAALQIAIQETARLTQEQMDALYAQQLQEEENKQHNQIHNPLGARSYYGQTPPQFSLDDTEQPYSNKTNNNQKIHALLNEMYDHTNKFFKRVDLLAQGTINVAQAMLGIDTSAKIFRENPKIIRGLIHFKPIEEQNAILGKLALAEKNVYALKTRIDNEIDTAKQKITSSSNSSNSSITIQQNSPVKKPELQNQPQEKIVPFEQLKQSTHTLFNEYSGKINLQNMNAVFPTCMHLNKHLEQHKVTLISPIYAPALQKHQAFETTRKKIIDLIKECYDLLEEEQPNYVHDEQLPQPKHDNHARELQEKKDIEEAIKRSTQK